MVDRHGFKQSASLDQRLLEQAERLRKEARGTPPGVERDRLLKLARQTDCTGLTLAERLCRTADRIDPAGMSGPHHCTGRGASAPHSEKLCGLLQRR